MIQAVQWVRRCRGGSQAHLMRCSDGFFYVVKFANNPQHMRVLPNEWFATKLGLAIGLPMSEVRIVEVSQWLIDHTPELVVNCGSTSERIVAGHALGIRFAVDPLVDICFDYLPENLLGSVKNVGDFNGALCLDKWTCNSDGRQAVFSRRPRARKYQATFIDQGYCFNAGEWNFPDSPLRGVYARNEVYSKVSGWDSFEPWLSRIEAMDDWQVAACAEGIPEQWHGNADELARLVDTVHARRSKVRDLIVSFRESSRAPFPNWKVAA